MYHKYTFQAHLHLSTIDWFIQGVENLASSRSPVYQSATAKVLTELCTFFVLWGIVQEAGDFLEVGGISLLAYVFMYLCICMFCLQYVLYYGYSLKKQIIYMK